jgi:putative ABC transport system ATP-binding protein
MARRKKIYCGVSTPAAVPVYGAFEPTVVHTRVIGGGSAVVRREEAPPDTTATPAEEGAAPVTETPPDEDARAGEDVSPPDADTARGENAPPPVEEMPTVTETPPDGDARGGEGVSPPIFGGSAGDGRKPLIEVRHVRKVYRMGDERIVALDDVSLEIYKGEIVCFLGTSGSGKSTFLNMVAGLEKPTRGEVNIGGIPLHKLNEEGVTLFRQKNIGFIFQAYNLLPMLTAMENVALPLIFRSVDRRKRKRMAADALRAVGLAGYEKRRPTQMSGGQQQRVGIARAIVGNPRILFADEPTGNLDTNTTKEVMRIIVGMVKENNQTMILVTHDRSIAEYADKIVTIRDGNIIDLQVKAPEGGNGA